MGMWSSFLSKLGIIDASRTYTIIFLDVDKIDIATVAEPHDVYADTRRLSLKISMLTSIEVLQNYIKEHFPYGYPHAFKINNSDKFLLSQLMSAPKDTNLLSHLKKYRYIPYLDSPSEINIQISTCTMNDLDKFGIDKSVVIRRYQSSAPVLGAEAEIRTFRRMLLLWANAELEKRASSSRTDETASEHLLLPGLTSETSRFVIEEARKATRSRRTL